ncbi:DUF2252 family protein [Virgibacillus siamensis]|uniref:DUF2252 family protein n=1 Tax=Virgibacillus siamensis TaxID=480071 RepID=A0ABP3RLS3_9BACI
MTQNLNDQIVKVREKLRMETIATVLDEFDGSMLHLDIDKRKRKYSKMLNSAFQFYRGSAFLFYYDVTNMPLAYHTPADKPTWLQGDLHFENFGAFKNRVGTVVYDTNDFDEGYFGSYIYDVLRMSVSIALYSEELGFQEDAQHELIQTYLEKYYSQLKEFATNGKQPDTLNFDETNTKGPVLKVVQELPGRESNEVLNAITTVNGSDRKFQDLDGLVHLSDDERNELEVNWHEYINSVEPENKQPDDFYQIKDVVKKIGAGTGSIGLKRYYILIEGNVKGNLGDIVLEAKEARMPAAKHFFPYDELFSDNPFHQGKRVITAQKAMQYLQDPYLGYFTIGDHHFYVRENSPYDEGVDPHDLTTVENMNETVELMGKVTAKAHARADELILTHQSEEEIIKAIGNEYDGFISQMIAATVYYKQQVNEDFGLFKQWCQKKYDL